MPRTLTHGQAIVPSTFTGKQVTSTANDSGQPDDQGAVAHVLIERADGTFFDEGVLPAGVTQPTGGAGLLGAIGNLIELLTLATNTSGTTGSGFNVRVTAGGGGGGGGIASSVTVTNTVAVAGAVSISNFPATQAVTGTVSIGNFPATQPVSGTVSVGNFPATQPVSAAALPLPTGAATAAKQAAFGAAGTASADVVTIQGIASMTPVAVSGTVGISGTATVAGAVSISNFPATQPVSGTISVGNFPATQTVAGSVSIANFPATQAVSVASLPLPSGAATAAKQPAFGAAGSASADVLSIQGIAGMTPVGVTVSGTTTVAGAVSISNFPATQPVSGTISIGNFPATQPVSGTVGISGSVAVTNTGLSNIPVQGQAAMAASVPVVIASNQSTITVQQQAALSAQATLQSAVITNNDGSATTFTIAGHASVTFTVSFVGTPNVGAQVNFSISEDGVNFAPFSVSSPSSGPVGVSTTTAGTFGENCAGYKAVRASVSGFTNGSGGGSPVNISVTAHASPVAYSHNTVNASIRPLQLNLDYVNAALTDNVNIANILKGDGSYAGLAALLGAPTFQQPAPTSSSGTTLQYLPSASGIDCANYPWLNIAITAQMSPAISCLFQCSPDQTNWGPCTLFAPSTTLNGGVQQSGVVDVGNGAGIGFWHGPRQARFFRLKVPANGGATGAVTMLPFLSAAPAALPSIGGAVRITDAGGDFMPTGDAVARTIFTTPNDGANQAYIVKSDGTAAGQGGVQIAPTGYTPAAINVNVSGSNTVLVQDCINFPQVKVDVTAYTSGTLTFQTCNDWNGTTGSWVSNPLFLTTITTGTGQASVQTTGVYSGPVQGRYFKILASGASTVATVAPSYSTAPYVPSSLSVGISDASGNRATNTSAGALNISQEGLKKTYSAACVAIAAAATPTDVFVVANPGGSGKTVRITHVLFSASATTTGQTDVSLVKRTSADTLGTTSAITPEPMVTGNTASCTAGSYTANPTLGTTQGSIRAKRLTLGATAGAAEWTFGTQSDQMPQLAPGEEFALNLNSSGQTITFTAEMSWTEE